MRPRWRNLAVVTVLAIVLGGHVVHWYFPRERSGAPDGESASGRLYLAGRQEVRLWIPYPHQNLAAAGGHLENPRHLLRAVGRLAGLGDVELPRFGPFAVPPSRAVALALDRAGGGGLAVAVDVYPAIAIVARLAGTVAGNPLLAGGPVVLSGRRYEVAWVGTSWTLSSGSQPGAVPAATPPSQPGLAWLTLVQPQDPLPTGRYRLWREGRTLVLSSGGGDPDRRPGLEDSARRLDLAYLRARFRPRGEVSVLLAPRGQRRALELPDSAVVWTPGAERLRLPGERVVDLLGLDLLTERVGRRWRIAAIGERSLAAARRLIPELEPYLVGSGLDSLLWLRPGEYRPLIGAIAEQLEALPVVARREVRFWRDLDTVLSALREVERIALESRTDGGVEVRLEWAE